MYGLAKSHRKEKVKEYNIKDINGNVLTDRSEVNDRWSEYFRHLLNVEMEEEE